jgi:hypothetical protein
MSVSSDRAPIYIASIRDDTAADDKDYLIVWKRAARTDPVTLAQKRSSRAKLSVIPVFDSRRCGSVLAEGLEVPICSEYRGGCRHAALTSLLAGSLT